MSGMMVEKAEELCSLSITEKSLPKKEKLFGNLTISI